MQGGERDNDLRSFFEFSNLTSNSQVNLNFPDDVLAIAQGNQLQNDVSLENRNLIQNPNSSLLNPNPNQNQDHQQPLFAPYENVQSNPNHNDFTETRLRSHYLLDAEQFMIPNHLHNFQNEHMARPSCNPDTNIASTSTSTGGTYISRSSRRRGDASLSIPSQSTGGSTIHHPSYPGTGSFTSQPMQQNMESFVRNTRMRLDPGEGRPSMVQLVWVPPNAAQYNMGFPRPSPNPLRPMNNHALASNTLSIPPTGPITNPHQLIAYHALVPNHLSIPLAGRVFFPTGPAPAPALAHRVTSQFRYTGNEAISTELPTSHHQHAQTNTVLAQPSHVQRTTLPIRDIASSGASQVRNQRVSRRRLVPTSSAASVSVSSHTASTSQTGNSGTLVDQERPSSCPPHRTSLPGGTSSTVPLLARGYEAISTELPPFHHQHAQTNAVLAEPAHVQRTGLPIRDIASSGTSLVRNQCVSLHQVVPTSSAASVSVSSHTASISQTGNSDTLVEQERSTSRPPHITRLPGGTSSTVPLLARDRYRQARYILRARYPEANEQQLEVLLRRAIQRLHERRQMDRYYGLRLDIDHMSHEELLALGERIGNINTGVSEEIINKRMRQRPFSALLENESGPCSICLEEYEEDDQLGLLDCGHTFHSECIKKWLAQKNLCPICKQPGIRT